MPTEVFMLFCGYGALIFLLFFLVFQINETLIALERRVEMNEWLFKRLEQRSSLLD